MDRISRARRGGCGFRPRPDTHVFLCGSPDMIESMTELLARDGFHEHARNKPGQVHVERYWPKKTGTGPAVPVATGHLGKRAFIKKADVLVTGATGLVGSRLVRVLVKSGEKQVVAMPMPTHGRAILLAPLPFDRHRISVAAHLALSRGLSPYSPG